MLVDGVGQRWTVRDDDIDRRRDHPLAVDRRGEADVPTDQRLDPSMTAIAVEDDRAASVLSAAPLPLG